MSMIAPLARPYEPQPGTKPEPAPLSVMVVDDCETVLLLVKAILGTFGFRDIRLCASAAAAMAELAARTPDIVLTDLELGDADGIAVARAAACLRTAHGTRPAVLLLTGYSEEEVAHLGGAVDGLIQKPFNSERLLGALMPLTSCRSPRR